MAAADKMKSLSRALMGCTAFALLLSACAPAPAVSTPEAPRDTVVTLTFDDGDADNFAAAAVLTQNKLRATWYIPSGRVGTPGYMTWDQLTALQARGHEIGGHTLDHISIGGLTGEELRRQVCDDRKALQARGFDAVSFAFPYGGYDDAVLEAVRECGYSSARAIGAGPESIPPANPFTLRAYPYLVNDTTLSKLQRYVTGTRREGGGWLILIFHHVCDGCDFFSVSPEVMYRFAAWLAAERDQGRVKVATVGEIVLNGAP